MFLLDPSGQLSLNFVLPILGAPCFTGFQDEAEISRFNTVAMEPRIGIKVPKVFRFLKSTWSLDLLFIN